MTLLKRLYFTLFFFVRSTIYVQSIFHATIVLFVVIILYISLELVIVVFVHTQINWTIEKLNSIELYSSESQSTKIKTIKKEVVTPNKNQQTKSHPKTHSSPHTNGTHGTQNSNNGSHGSNKKKKLAEMLVDRVFRKAGSSFKVKVPISLWTVRKLKTCSFRKWTIIKVWLRI